MGGLLCWIGLADTGTDRGAAVLMGVDGGTTLAGTIDDSLCLAGLALVRLDCSGTDFSVVGLAERVAWWLRQAGLSLVCLGRSGTDFSAGGLAERGGWWLCWAGLALVCLSLAGANFGAAALVGTGEGSVNSMDFGGATADGVAASSGAVGKVADGTT
ncbi:hypothetical protein THII_1163 [Thioploca ingrica]|uniref:Uncharacterized protein n=1 Tax=Thioploca ingrica TaxID=40754 RepID=A0A090AKC0_9GAMM|nr:hypothetical protein THII_1163 [Thioploca ingrica]